MQGCTYPAHCAATAERGSPQSNSPAVHPRALKQSAHCKETRTVPRASQALHKRRRGRRRTMCRLCTNLHLFTSPAPARSAVKRTGSVTTGHQTVPWSNRLRSKIEGRLPPSLLPKPLFFFSTEHGALLFLRAWRKRRGGCISTKEMGVHPQPRAPAAAAAFRSATARRAALSAQMRVSFSPAGKKRNGGRNPPVSLKGKIPAPPAGTPMR